MSRSSTNTTSAQPDFLNLDCRQWPSSADIITKLDKVCSDWYSAEPLVLLLSNSTRKALKTPENSGQLTVMFLQRRVQTTKRAVEAGTSGNATNNTKYAARYFAVVEYVLKKIDARKMDFRRVAGYQIESEKMTKAMFET